MKFLKLYHVHEVSEANSIKRWVDYLSTYNHKLNVSLESK